MKKIAIMLFVTGCAAVSQAAYLYWQVSSGGEAFTITEPTKVNAAAIVYGTVDQSGNFTKVGSDQYYQVNTVNGVGSMASAVALDVSGSAFANYSYYIELYNYVSSTDVSTLGQSEMLTYTQLNDKGFIDTGLTPVIPAAWTGGTYAAPEPTSGLLMLLGVAALGLKRRKA